MITFCWLNYWITYLASSRKHLPKEIVSISRVSFPGSQTHTESSSWPGHSRAGRCWCGGEFMALCGFNNWICACEWTRYSTNRGGDLNRGVVYSVIAVFDNTARLPPTTTLLSVTSFSIGTSSELSRTWWGIRDIKLDKWYISRRLISGLETFNQSIWVL